MATIVHVTADFPDAFAAAKTPAVSRLIALVPDHRHIVYSLNRVDGLGGITVASRTGDVASLVYRTPPYGLLLERGLAPVARFIAEDLARHGLVPDLVHAHKFSIDGLVADRVAATASRPLITSFWGNTDQKVIRLKPLLRARYRTLAHRAALILPATPWAGDWARDTLTVAPEKLRLLPIVCDLKPFAASAPVGPRLATLFNLDHYRLKNLPRLLAALARLVREGSPATLDILGGGSAETVAAIRALVARAGLTDRVRLAGAVPHADVQRVLSDYAALLLPSRRETFGMVFVEALFAGIPILYPKGQAVDGYFDDADVGVRADAGSEADIAAGMGRLLADEAGFKARIAALHARAYFRHFEAPAIAAVYEDAIRDALAARARSLTSP